MYIYDTETFEKIRSLEQGYIIRFDSNFEIVIAIKTDIALLTNLINGCPFHFLINKKNSYTSLIIEDNKESPFYITAKDFSKTNSDFKNFENIIIDLLKSEKITVNYFNDSNFQLFTTELNKNNDFQNFINWVNSNNENEYQIEIKNIAFTGKKDIIFLDLIENNKWGNNGINGKPYYKFSDYLGDGKHGYNQEHNLRSVFSKYFIPNEELFYSIKKVNNLELTDFTIIYKKAILLIESKYTLSSKQNKFNDAIVKSIQQLNNAENILRNELQQIKELEIKEKIKNFQIILKICVFNDDGRNLENAFKNVKNNFDKRILPIFISVYTLKQTLSFLQLNTKKNYKVNIIENLLKLTYENREREIIVIDEMDIENGIITLL
ncbi:hypothetical protein [Flavobacterium sp.]